MNRAGPALWLCAAVLLASTGCRTASHASPSDRMAQQTHTPSFSETMEQSRDSYVTRRSKELVRNGTFDTKEAARDFARYEWSQQHHTAQALSGEGFHTSSAPLRSSRAQQKAEKFKRDLADLDLSRP
jgi:hypothetical protein